MSSVKLTKIQTNCGLINLCDNPIAQWVIPHGECDSCLSLNIRYWNIPVESPLKWVKTEFEDLCKKLVLDKESLVEFLHLPKEMTSIIHRFERSTVENLITYGGFYDYSLATIYIPFKSYIDVTALVTVQTRNPNYNLVKISLYVNGQVKDFNFVDLRNINDRENLIVMWAGVVNQGNLDIYVKIENIAGSGTDINSVYILDKKIKLIENKVL